MLPWSSTGRRRLEQTTYESALLRGNPLGDPHERPVLVYLPPGYDDSDQRYPVVYVTHGLHRAHRRCGSTARRSGSPYPELLDAMFATGDVPPAIVVFVDAWTRYGGSQCLDSPGTGQYQSYLCDEIVPWVDATYRTIADRDHRAVTGKSSGGYTAMVMPLLRPDVFSALATHAGDAAFELCYRDGVPEVRPHAARQVRRRLPEVLRGPPRAELGGTKDSDIDLLEIYGYASAYSGEPGRDGAAAVRRPRRDDPGDLGALAGRRPGRDGRRSRSTPRPLRSLRPPSGSTPAAPTSTTSTSVPLRSTGGCTRPAYRRRGCTSSCSRANTAGSSTATRWPCAGCASSCRIQVRQRACAVPSGMSWPEGIVARPIDKGDADAWAELLAAKREGRPGGRELRRRRPDRGAGGSAPGSGGGHHRPVGRRPDGRLRQGVRLQHDGDRRGPGRHRRHGPSGVAPARHRYGADALADEPGR